MKIEFSFANIRIMGAALPGLPALYVLYKNVYLLGFGWMV